MVRGVMTTGTLARHGFGNTERAQRLLGDPALAGLTEAGVERIGETADADDALIGLLRVAEAARAEGSQDVSALLAGIDASDDPGARLVTLLGSSVALGDFLTRHPEHLGAVEIGARALELPAEEIRGTLLRAVGANPAAAMPVAELAPREARDALRVAYHERLVEIAVADLVAADPGSVQPAVSAALADLADAALETALATARASVEGHEGVRLAILAMGKTGARELNYISDVDVVYVAGCADVAVGTPSEGSDDEMLGIAAALCREIARVCSDRTAEGSLWPVDANLRPEGKDGPLARTLDSCRQYYTRWAKSWEFQAMLKARPAAGDRALGDAFIEMITPMVWKASTRESFVEDSRAMRRRVIDHIPSGEAERNLKLGPGGLRDVEFTVQLLQMVHGRGDETLRVRDTLTGLARLRDGGYIGRDSAAELDGAYRFLRAVEHRLQLHRLRRTHVLPTSPTDIRRLARGLGQDPTQFTRHYENIRRRVRHLHEEIYYRPLLVTASNLSDGQVRLTPEAAQSRLAAIGYRDPRRALGHITALTEGISRRAAIQRQLLPSLLEWFSEGIDPDLGLLAFRRLSDRAGSAHWYMGLLRDSGVAARRLTRVLSSSRFVGEELEQIPEAVRWLSRDEELHPLSREGLEKEFDAVIRRVGTADDATDVLRRTRRRELLRVAMAHLVGIVEPREVAHALTAIAEAVLRSGLRVAAYTVALEHPEARFGEGAGELTTHSACAHLGIDFAIIAMGSFGACELGYSSDADVQFVVADRGAGARTGELAVQVATALQKILNAPSAGADMKVSAELRPEGRNGVLARSLASWKEYFTRSAETWERQALLRARVITGGESLVTDLTAAMDLARYPSDGLTGRMRRDIVTMKARIEGERLPRGADRARHLKLGRGSMTDVEWVVQLLVMDGAHDHPAVRGRTNTLDSLGILVDEGLLPRASGQSLGAAWRLAWGIRRALFLWKDREPSTLPVDRDELRAAALIILGDEGTAAGLEEDYLRVTRHARGIAEEIIFGESGA